MKKYGYLAATFGFLLLATFTFKIIFKKVTPKSIERSQINNTKSLPEIHELISGAMIVLPEPITKSDVSLEKALSIRRSVRSYVGRPLSINELSQLLWAGQGVTDEMGLRTAPSAGATYPLELFILVNKVEGLHKGIYHYQSDTHQLKMVDQRQVEKDLVKASLNQNMIEKAGAVIIFAAEFERTTASYGERGIRYIHNEVGHVAQNIYLQASALGLGTVVIGSFRDKEVEILLNLGNEYSILYLMPVGKI